MCVLYAVDVLNCFFFSTYVAASHVAMQVQNTHRNKYVATYILLTSQLLA